MLDRYKQANNLQRIRKVVAPGNCKIYFMPVECVQTNPYVEGIAGKINTIPIVNVKWNVAECEQYSKDYTEEQKDSTGGSYIECSVNGYLPLENQTNHLSLNNMKHQGFMVVVVAPTGLTKWLGTKENPVRLKHAFNSGKRSGNTNAGNQISFIWQSENKPLLLGQAIPKDSIATL
jgi:hypothetical protein